MRALDGKSAAELPLFDQPHPPARTGAETKLPTMPLGEHVIQDYRSLGLSLKAHPVAFLREQLDDRAGVTPNAHLSSVRDGRRVSVAGLVLVRQRGQGTTRFPDAGRRQGRRQHHFWERTFTATGPSSWEHGSFVSPANCSQDRMSSTSSRKGSRI